MSGDAPDGLLNAFWAYERALMANDLEALDALFAPGPLTLRGDAGGLLVGHDAISEFRSGRGGSPQRRILAVEVRVVSDSAALVVAVTAPLSGGRGQQTQLWKRLPDTGAWVVEAAHVSLPAPAIATTIWRVVGSPLVRGASHGELLGDTVAVKDLFSVAGHRVGGGVPGYLDDARPASVHAPAVTALLAAGANVTGIAQTDEFAYSIAGRNPHFGTPPNPAVVGGIPGGSSSGPASAVALGQVSIGLGTDTGGSIRVPASYQGLWGLRTTHGAVSVGGLLALAPSFDTVGWLTRDAATVARAARASLAVGDQRTVEPRFVVMPALSAVLQPEVRPAFHSALEAMKGLGLDDIESIDLDEALGLAPGSGIDHLFETFRTVQAAEAWRTHGEWFTAHPGALGADIAGRFDWARSLGDDVVARARVDLAAARASLSYLLGDSILLLPSASSAAPSATADATTIERTRSGTLRLTCIAGITGRPGLSVPLMGVAQPSSPLPAPVGLCLVGPRYSDLALVELASSLVE